MIRFTDIGPDGLIRRLGVWLLVSILLVLGSAMGGCTTDFSATTDHCGDGVIQPDETCDDANTASGDGCGTSCEVEDGWSCTGAVSVCETLCGDGVARGTEACDGSDLRSLSCSELGLGAGTLSCGIGCTFDTAHCALQSVCGNGSVEPSEECDGDNLVGQTCEGLSLAAGTLSCGQSCLYDVTGCSAAAVCGNDAIEYPEVCDGVGLAGWDCTNLGFSGGTLGCDPDCTRYDINQCVDSCGNNVVDGGEECDGADLGGETCAFLGCRSGTLACNTSCTFDPSGCYDNHDEDEDGVDDNCDNCPTVSNPAQQNGDADEVGDACEDPNDPGLLSELLAFESLVGSSGSWTAILGTWTLGPDDVTGSHTVGANFLHDDPLPQTGYSVEATFHMNSPPTAGSNRTGVLFAWSHATGNTQTYECAFERGEKTVGVFRTEGSIYVLLADVDTVTTVQDHQWHRLRVYYNGNSVRCVYTDETGASGEVEVSGADVWSDMSGETGLRVFNETATFTSFVVYR